MAKKCKIVLIDDNKAYISLISDILRSKGHDVLCISDLKVADSFIEELGKKPSDLQIVLDYVFDNKRVGDKLARRIKEANRDTFIVMISACDRKEAKIIDELLNDKTIDAFVEKPLDFNALCKVLRLTSSPA